MEESREKEKKCVANIGRSMLSKYILCDNCLGRQFAQLLTGLSNKERGEAIRRVIAMSIEARGSKVEGKLAINLSNINFRNIKIKENNKERCEVCNDIFKQIDEYASRALSLLEGYEYKTFLVGIVPPANVVRKEEEIWEEFGAESAELFKEHLSREIGKRIAELSGKEVDFKKPDVVVLFDLERDIISFTIRSLYIYGKYNKYAEMPQTKWLCPECEGVGCSKCNYTGKLYNESIQEIIESPLLKATKGKESKFHGAGREDIDALCHGWREFVIEIVEPIKRHLDLKKIEEEINKEGKGKVEVKDLRIVDKEKVREIKEKRQNKTYEVVVTYSAPLTKEKIREMEEFFKNKIINQQTPKRVEKRRADKVRRKRIYYVKVKDIDEENREMVIEIKAEAGTYIKELVHGDEGRTRPSLSSFLEQHLHVKKLTVTKFE